MSILDPTDLSAYALATIENGGGAMPDVAGIRKDRSSRAATLLELARGWAHLSLGPSVGDDEGIESEAGLGPSVGDDVDFAGLGPSVGDDVLRMATLGPSVGDDVQPGVQPLGPSVGDDAQV